MADASLYVRSKTLYARDDEVDYSGKDCPNCGHEAFRRDCWECGADGSFDGYEDDPLWYSPGDRIECQTCHGTGWHHWCPLCGWDLLLPARFNSPRARGMALVKWKPQS